MSIQQIQVFFSCSSFCIAPIPAVILIQQLLNTYCMLDIKWWYLTSKNLKCRGQKGVKTEAVSAVEVWARPQTRPLLGQPRVCLAAARSAPGGHSPLAQGGAAHLRTAFSQGREGRRDGRKARRNLLAVSGQTPRRPSLKRCVFRPIHQARVFSESAVQRSDHSPSPPPYTPYASIQLVPHPRPVAVLHHFVDVGPLSGPTRGHRNLPHL